MPPSGRFAQFMLSAMKARRITLRDLSKRIDFSYEHLRGIANGERQPNIPLLEKLCGVLRLDYNEMLASVTRDKMERQHGPAALAAAFDKSPRLAQYEQLVPFLTEEQNGAVLKMMRSLVASNRERARVSGAEEGT